MYCNVAPGFGGRATRQPEESLDGTGKDVVVVGEVVVRVAAAAGAGAGADADADADAGENNGATPHAPTTLNRARLNAASEVSVGSQRRTERAQLSWCAVIAPFPGGPVTA